MVLLCQSRFPHLAKVPTPCFYMSQGFRTLSRFPHLVSMSQGSTPCQGFHTLFLYKSRFPHLAKVPTPCFYVSQGFHTLSRFPHLVATLVKVSTPCQGFYTLLLSQPRFPHIANVSTYCFVFTHCHRCLHTFLFPKPIHLSHIFCFMYITWGNFLGFILFVHLEIQVYTYHMICQEHISVSFIHKIQFDIHM